MNPAMRTVLVLMSVLAGACARQQDAPAAAIDVQPRAVVARGWVDVEGGALALGMSVDGVISEVKAREGDAVTRGQPLIVMDPTPALLDEDQAKARLAQAQAQVLLLAPKLTAAGVRAGRLAEAARAGAGDGQSADDAREATAQAAAELASARAGVELARADLRHAQYQAGQHVLRAPLDGAVLRVAAWPGMRVSAQGAPLLTMLPATPRIVRAELSQDALDDVDVGTKARILSDDGRQADLGDAHVLRIGRTYGQSKLQEDPLQRTDERSVECVLAFDATSHLRVGQRVLVRFAPVRAQAALDERLPKPHPGRL